MKHTTNTESHTGKYEPDIDYYNHEFEENDLYTIKRKTTFSFAEVVELLKSKKEKKNDT